MSVSEVQICNLALNRVGNLSITSLEDASKEGRACKVFYPICRDWVMERHPWNFAMARADISAQVEPAPAFGFDYAYTLPTDCLRAWEIVGSTAEWIAEDGQLLTDLDEEIYLSYIKRITTTGRFSVAFAECISVKLAAELANKLASDKALRKALLEELYNVSLPDAYRLNAEEGNRPATEGAKDMSKSSYAWQSEGR